MSGSKQRWRILPTDFRTYWRTVWSRACADTRKSFGSPPWLPQIISALAVLAALVLLYARNPWSEVMEQVHWYEALVPVLLAFVAIVFVINLLAAPHRMDRDARKRISELEERLSHAPVRMEIFRAEAGRSGGRDILSLSVLVQFHNGASQPLTVHDLGLNMIHRTTQATIPDAHQLPSFVYEERGMKNCDLARGILVPAGESSPRYWWKLALMLPLVPLTVEHVAVIKMSTMNQPDQYYQLPVPWEAVKGGTTQIAL